MVSSKHTVVARGKENVPKDVIVLKQIDASSEGKTKRGKRKKNQPRPVDIASAADTNSPAEFRI